jgi:photosystem II stability/assembly factor-like uncharacterized protein
MISNRSFHLLGKTFLQIILSANLLSTSTSYAQWVQTSGPYGGSVTCFAEIPPSSTNSVSYLFAGTNNGVFLSTDRGAGWKPVSSGLTNLTVTAFAVIDTNLFAGTYNGVFLSSDYGASWSPARTGLTSPYVYALTVTRNSSGGAILFAGTSTGGVSRSTNFGSSWTAVNTGLSTNSVRTFAGSAEKLFAGTSFGVFLSTNNGDSWKVLTSSPGNYSTQCLALDQNQSGGVNIYAGTLGSGVLLSTDGGATWAGVKNGMKDNNIKALAFVGGNLYAGTYSSGMFVLAPGASSWIPMNSGLTSQRVASLFLGSTTTGTANLFGGTVGGVFVSTDNGGIWRAANNGLTNTQGVCFSIGGTGSKSLFVGCLDAGLFVSTDLGSSWKAMNNGLGASNTYVCSLSYGSGGGGPSFFAGTADGLYRSSDNGANWSAVNPETRGWYLYALAATTKHVFASRDLSLYRSSDNGTTWTELITGWPRTRIIELVVCPTEQGGMNIYAANNHQDSDNGIFCSTDEGITWTPVNNGLTNRSVDCFAAIPNGLGGTHLFAGTSYSGVFASTNYGASWTAINSGLTDTAITALASGVDDSGRRILLAGTQSGQVFISANNGATWKSAGSGLNAGAVKALQVLADGSGAGYIFAVVGNSGVWRRPLSELAVDVSGQTNSKLPSAFMLQQNYPNPFNPATTIGYQLMASSSLTLKVYDLLGREVADLVNGVKNAGYHSVTWDAGMMPSGVYLYKLTAGDFLMVCKMVLLR